jgi:hypothetical protein
MLNDVVGVGLEKKNALTRFTLHALGTLAHSVTFACSTALDFALAGDAETLFGPAVGLELRHLMFLRLALFLCFINGLCQKQTKVAAGHVYAPARWRGIFSDSPA